MTTRTVAVQLTGSPAQLKAALRSAAADIDRFGAHAEGGNRKAARAFDDTTKAADRTEDSVQNVGLAAAAAGAAIALGIGKAVSSFADFDQQMSNVQASTRATAGEMSLLRQAALDAGASTVFSATEAAQAIENLAKAGVAIPDILSGGLRGSLSLAASAQIEVAAAAEIVAGARAQFKLAGTEIPRVADLIAAGAGKASGEAVDLAAALAQSGLVAAQMGLSIEETAGTLAAFASNMLLGSDAGTSLKSMLLQLANPSKESAELMKELGIAAYDAQGNFVGIKNLAGQLQEAFKGQSQATRDAALAQIFGSDAIRAASILYSEGAAGIAEWTRQTDDAGFAARDAAARLDNLKGDVEALAGAISTELIGAGADADGVLRGLTKSATGTVQIFGDLPGPVQQTASGLTLAAGAATVAAGAFILGAPKVAAFRTELAGMGGAASRFGSGILRVGRVLGGPWGLVLAASTVALGYFAKGHAEAKSRIEEFTAAIQADSGALGDNARERAFYFAQQQGLLDQAKELGISKRDVVDAILGEADAQERLNAAIKAYVDPLRDFTGANSIAAVKVNAFRGDLAGLSGEVQSAVDLEKERAEVLGGSTAATDAAAASGAEYTGRLKDTTGALDDATNAVDEYRTALDALNGVNITAAEQQIALQEAIGESRKAVDRNRGDVSLDERSALLNLAKQGGDTALSVFEKTGSYEKANGVLRRTRREFVDLAEAMGMSREKARRFRDEVLGIPEFKSTTFRTPGMAKALDDGQSLRQLMDDLDGRTVTARVNVASSGKLAQLAAAGYADGGMLRGPYIGPRADNVLYRGTPGEWVQPKAAVDYYGLGAMEAIRTRRLPRDLTSRVASLYAGIPGYRDGGQVGRGVTPPSWRSPAPHVVYVTPPPNPARNGPLIGQIVANYPAPARVGDTVQMELAAVAHTYGLDL